MSTSLGMTRHLSNFKLSYRLPVTKRFYCKSTDEPKIPKNTIKDVFSGSLQKGFGIPAGKKPFKMRLEAGKTYFWCTCGQSHNQPFCDGTHKNVFLKITMKPVTVKVEETKDYWLCMCKQTLNRPFCDGNHKREDIQEKRFI